MHSTSRIVEEQKKKLEEIVIEKKNTAATLIEEEETTEDSLQQTRCDVVTETASNECIKQTVRGFECEATKETDKAVDATMHQVSNIVDENLEQSEQYFDAHSDAVKLMSSSGESMSNPTTVGF